MSTPTAAIAPHAPLRVALLWNGALQAEQLLREPRAVKLGPGPDALFALPDGANPAHEVTLLAPVGPRFVLQPAIGLGGFVVLGGKRREAGALRAAAELGPSDYGVVTLGSVALFFQHVRAEQAPVTERRSRDAALLASLGLSIFWHVGALLFLFLIAAKEFAPVDELEVNTELLKRFMVVPPPPDERAAARRDRSEDKQEHGNRDKKEQGGKKAEHAEGKVGKKDATQDTTHIAGEPKDAIATKVRGMGLLGVLAGGADNSGRSALALPQLDKMLGGMGSMQTVVGRGSGGFGLRGTGVGGGGNGQGTLFGAGELGTGVGAGTGNGRGRGARPGPPAAAAKEAHVALDEGGAKVHGFLSKEQIERVVRANQAAIKYCFESEIQHQPNLAGAVHMNWRIDLQGHVTVARVAKSTLGNARVEGCMARQIKRWTFPKPDGGEVEVTYPFLLRGG